MSQPAARRLQRIVEPCACGQAAPVVRVTPYEFDWACACGRCGCISWSHRDPPPDFLGDAAPLLPGLRSGLRS